MKGKNKIKIKEQRSIRKSKKRKSRKEKGRRGAGRFYSIVLEDSPHSLERLI
jgi:hypothetical protein